MLIWIYERLIFRKAERFNIVLKKDCKISLENGREIAIHTGAKHFQKSNLEGIFRITLKGKLIKQRRKPKNLEKIPILEFNYAKNYKSLKGLCSSSSKNCSYLFELICPGNVSVDLIYDGKNFLAPDLVFYP